MKHALHGVLRKGMEWNENISHFRLHVGDFLLLFWQRRMN